MAPSGTNLSLTQLVDALLYKTTKSKRDRLGGCTLEELTKMESQLQVAASSLRGERNRRQGINRLPRELLCIVFSMTQNHTVSFLPNMPPPPSRVPLNNGPWTPPGPTSPPQSWRWTVLLSICRQWRGIIAITPSLWATIDANTAPDIFLKRSAAAQLAVYLGPHSYHEHPNASFLEALVKPQHIGRLRELHAFSDDWNSLHQRLIDPAPSLTSLTLISHGKQNGPQPPPAPFLPANFFGAQLPKLRQLTLGFFTSWPSTIFRNLTHLCLHDQSSFAIPRTDMFLTFLEGSPQLEQLALVRAGPTLESGTDSAVEPGRYVDLPQLRLVDLGDWPTVSVVARFLSYLSLSPEADVYVWGGPLRDRDEDIGQLLPNDLSHLPNIDGRIKTWSFARQDPSGPTYNPNPALTDVPYVAFLGSTQTLDMYGDFTVNQVVPAFTSMKFPVSGVENFRVRDALSRPPRFTKEVWARDILGNMPLLKNLTILGLNASTTTRTIMAALHPQRADEGQVDDTADLKRNTKLKPGIVCPLLTSLTIEHDQNLPSIFISRVAEERAKAGSPLQSLTVYSFSPHLERKYHRANARQPPQNYGHAYPAPPPPPPPGQLFYPNSPPSSSGSSDEVDDETASRWVDDMDVLKEHVQGEVVFDHDKPFSIIAPTTWPTRALTWTHALRPNMW